MNFIFPRMVVPSSHFTRDKAESVYFEEVYGRRGRSVITCYEEETRYHLPGIESESGLSGLLLALMQP